jgi:hypothetical protein
MLINRENKLGWALLGACFLLFAAVMATVETTIKAFDRLVTSLSVLGRGHFVSVTGTISQVKNTVHEIAKEDPSALLIFGVIGFAMLYFGLHVIWSFTGMPIGPMIIR